MRKHENNLRYNISKELIMIKKILTTSLVVSALIFSGCGESGEGEAVLATQQMLDNGDFVGVIDKLESRASTTGDYLSLASAYMGKAGFSLSSIIGTVAASADAANGDAFATYIEDSKRKSNSRSLNDLDAAVAWYQKVVANKCLDSNAILTGAESDICLYVGLSKVSQTAVAIGYIANDVAILTAGTGGSDNKLTASTCAMQYANGSSYPKCTLSGDNNITFSSNGKTYNEVTFTVGAESFDNLITYASPKSTAITNGFCTLNDFTTRVDYKVNTDYHVCPVNESATEKDMTTEETIVMALNEGINSVSMAASQDVQQDINEFRDDILAANGRQNDADKTITVEDLIKYLDNKNQ